MTKKLLMGNEAMAFAALEAGVRVVAGYPGTPSSEIVETVARLRSSGTARGVHVEWSTNEKTALEVYEEQGHKCVGANCPEHGRELEFYEMEADHIVPWSKGGKTVKENCQMLCRHCNRTKSNK